jgi:hypothetical protein
MRRNDDVAREPGRGGDGGFVRTQMLEGSGVDILNRR